jgi:molecular chaperone GrpE
MSLQREEILRRFEAWLDIALDGEPPPEGVPDAILASITAGAESSGDHADLYSMQAAVTALTQEVKLQGRSFKQLSETLTPVAELAPRLADMKREAQESARREMLDVLLDLRDRLRRGLEAARKSSINETAESGWIARLLSRNNNHVLRQATEAMAAIQKGYQMSLDHLDDVLANFDVREIPCQGRRFDPASMDAVDVQETESEQDGVVVEIYRAGYEWKGEVYRPAQVKVARRPATASLEDPNDE